MSPSLAVTVWSQYARNEQAHKGDVPNHQDDEQQPASLGMRGKVGVAVAASLVAVLAPFGASDEDRREHHVHEGEHQERDPYQVLGVVGAGQVHHDRGKEQYAHEALGTPAGALDLGELALFDEHGVSEPDRQAC